MLKLYVRIVTINQTQSSEISAAPIEGKTVYLLHGAARRPKATVAHNFSGGIPTRLAVGLLRHGRRLLLNAKFLLRRLLGHVVADLTAREIVAHDACNSMWHAKLQKLLQ